MRVLWSSINSAYYSSKLNAAYNGGGCVPSLEKIVKIHSNIQFEIAFEYKSSKFKDGSDNVDYYPISVCCNYRKNIEKNSQ